MLGDFLHGWTGSSRIVRSSHMDCDWLKTSAHYSVHVLTSIGSPLLKISSTYFSDLFVLTLSFACFQQSALIWILVRDLLSLSLAENPAASMLPTAVALLPRCRSGPAGLLLMAVSGGGDGPLGEHLFVDWRQRNSHCFHSCLGRGFSVLDSTLRSRGRLVRHPNLDTAGPNVSLCVFSVFPFFTFTQI